MKISVITVVYNGELCIEKTIKNIINQTYSKIEFIIIDGNSKDNTLAIIEKYRSNIDLIVTENDKGIYDAMNKGLSFSTGDYVIFMNCDDTFYEVNTLEKIASLIEKNKFPDFIYGDSFEESDSSKKLYSKPARNHKFIWYGMFAHHQAMLYKKTLIIEQKIFYDLKYKIGADYAFTAVFLSSTRNILKLNFAVCIFKQDGASATNYKIGLKEQWHIRKKVLHSNFFIIIGLYMFHYLIIKLRQMMPNIYNNLRFRKNIDEC